MISYPNLWALVPCLAAAGLLAVGRAGPTSCLAPLEWRPVVFTGLVSYSLYLWHAPALTLFERYNIVPPTALQIAVLLAGVYAVSVVSYLFIEQPVRRRRVLVPNGRLLAVLALAMLRAPGARRGADPHARPAATVRPAAAAPGRAPRPASRRAHAAWASHPRRCATASCAASAPPRSRTCVPSPGATATPPRCCRPSSTWRRSVAWRWASPRTAACRPLPGVSSAIAARSAAGRTARSSTRRCSAWSNA